KGKTNRAVVLEIFTGVHCGPCIAADIAFDALLKTYEPKDVVLLQYHMHAPAPDPLTNSTAEARAEFYNANGTPMIFINGKSGPGGGGGRSNAKTTYDNLRNALDKQLEEDDEGKLKLSAERKGDKITFTAEVSGLKKTGEDIRLRFALVQDVVRYV